MPDNPYAIIPVGSILPFAGQLNQANLERLIIGGWLPCDGRALNSTDREYAVLFGVIGTSHGAGFDDHGVKVGDFNLPDYRGRFLRGVAEKVGVSRDPDVDRREAMQEGGNSQNAVGSIQDDATRMPRKNPFVTDDPGDHHHDDPTWNGVDGGQYELATLHRHAGGFDYGSQSAPTGEKGHHQHSIVNGGDAETRPKNAYVHWIIRYKQV